MVCDTLIHSYGSTLTIKQITHSETHKAEIHSDEKKVSFLSITKQLEYPHFPAESANRVGFNLFKQIFNHGKRSRRTQHLWKFFLFFSTIFLKVINWTQNVQLLPRVIRPTGANCQLLPSIQVEEYSNGNKRKKKVKVEFLWLSWWTSNKWVYFRFSIKLQASIIFLVGII